MIETKYEYFNILSKLFAESKNPFSVYSDQILVYSDQYPNRWFQGGRKKINFLGDMSPIRARRGDDPPIQFFSDKM